MSLALETNVNTDPLIDLLERELRRATAATDVPPELLGRALYDPLREFLARPRKGLRASLVETGWQLGGGRGPVPPELPMVVEVLHAGSLIIDDIEDAAIMRRSRPAMHQLYGMPLALNAGNWLYFWSMALLERIPGEKGLHAELYQLATRTFLTCHHGQAMDLSLAVTSLERTEVPRVVRAISTFKTAALVEFGLLLGARAAGANRLVLAALSRLGSALGTSIQMLDDIGGLTRDDRCLKGHEDLLNARATWPWAWLADSSCDQWDELIALAKDVESGEAHPELLAERIRCALGNRGTEAVHAQIDATLSALHTFDSSPSVDALAAAIRSLERTYA